ncbi:universal stress protein [Citreimonas salinaria]|uniref:Nucleotide-binding universal stress protein, UspA family n=1 Tax=Citreimonas salinaria TaxID=321339 RepID=A0A1H3MSY9_9RHOB|nr:universal stress protein [Citreimonas salinaria]SDY79614.1 Nucleotide-binding universal stress protein, UspA family [Citreimonas salinaria]
MSYRTLSTISMDGSPDAVEAAIACARLWSAHLDVTCTAQCRIEPGIMFAPEVGVVDEAMVHEAMETLEAAEERMRQRLAGESFGWSVRTDVIRSIDTLRRIASDQRYSDLVVLSAPGEDPAAQEMLETVLHNTRVPVLVVPEGVEPRFDRIVVAWDESDVALAAARAALPLLTRAGSVGIVTVDPERDTSGHDLAVMLDRAGITAPVTAVASSGRGIPKALAAHARDVDAQLVVMGAYGHRRLRDMILGGVSRTMLRDTAVPLLVAR